MSTDDSTVSIDATEVQEAITEIPTEETTHDDDGTLTESQRDQLSSLRVSLDKINVAHKEELAKRDSELEQLKAQVATLSPLANVIAGQEIPESGSEEPEAQETDGLTEDKVKQLLWEQANAERIAQAPEEYADLVSKGLEPSDALEYALAKNGITTVSNPPTDTTVPAGPDRELGEDPLDYVTQEHLSQIKQMFPQKSDKDIVMLLKESGIAG